MAGARRAGGPRPLAPDVQPTRRLFTAEDGSFSSKDSPCRLVARAGTRLGAPRRGFLVRVSPRSGCGEGGRHGTRCGPGPAVVRDAEGLRRRSLAHRGRARSPRCAAGWPGIGVTISPSSKPGSRCWPCRLRLFRAHPAHGRGALPAATSVDARSRSRCTAEGRGARPLRGRPDAARRHDTGLHAHAPPHHRARRSRRPAWPGRAHGEGRSVVTSVEVAGGSSLASSRAHAGAALEPVNPQGMPLRWEPAAAPPCARASSTRAARGSTPRPARRPCTSLPRASRARSSRITIEDGGRHALGCRASARASMESRLLPGSNARTARAAASPRGAPARGGLQRCWRTSRTAAASLLLRGRGRLPSSSTPLRGMPSRPFSSASTRTPWTHRPRCPWTRPSAGGSTPGAWSPATPGTLPGTGPGRGSERRACRPCRDGWKPRQPLEP